MKYLMRKEIWEIVIILLVMFVVCGVWLFGVVDEMGKEKKQEQIQQEIANKIDAYFTELENPENTYVDSCMIIRDSANLIFLRNFESLSHDRFEYFFDELMRADSLFVRRKSKSEMTKNQTLLNCIETINKLIETERNNIKYYDKLRKNAKKRMNNHVEERNRLLTLLKQEDEN